jgi:hypothetical protein
METWWMAAGLAVRWVQPAREARVSLMTFCQCHALEVFSHNSWNPREFLHVQSWLTQMTYMFIGKVDFGIGWSSYGLTLSWWKPMILLPNLMRWRPYTCCVPFVENIFSKLCFRVLINPCLTFGCSRQHRCTSVDHDLGWSCYKGIHSRNQGVGVER